LCVTKYKTPKLLFLGVYKMTPCEYAKTHKSIDSCACLRFLGIGVYNLIASSQTVILNFQQIHINQNFSQSILGRFPPSYIPPLSINCCIGLGFSLQSFYSYLAKRISASIPNAFQPAVGGLYCAAHKFLIYLIL